MSKTDVNPVVNISSTCGTKVQKPSEDQYYRVDEELLAKNPEFVDGNAFHDTLRGGREILTYEVYQKREGQEVACIIHIGDKLNGHPGIVHGGIISTAFDNSYGWLLITQGVPPAFTANLNVNFRKPIFQNTMATVRARITEIKGRKIFLSATWENSEGEVLADSTALFITPKME